MNRKVRWKAKDLANPESICIHYREGYYDVIHGCELDRPYQRSVETQRNSLDTLACQPTGKLGAVTSEARMFCESLIKSKKP